MAGFVRPPARSSSATPSARNGSCAKRGRKADLQPHLLPRSRPENAAATALRPQCRRWQRKFRIEKLYRPAGKEYVSRNPEIVLFRYSREAVTARSPPQDYRQEWENLEKAYAACQAR